METKTIENNDVRVNGKGMTDLRKATEDVINYVETDISSTSLREGDNEEEEEEDDDEEEEEDNEEINWARNEATENTDGENTVERKSSENEPELECKCDLNRIETDGEYHVPVEEVEKAAKRVLPDLVWPIPYEGIFDHLRNRNEAEITDNEAYYATDLENEDECLDDYDGVQRIYMTACKELDIIPNSLFLRNLPNDRIIIRHQSLDHTAAKSISIAMMSNSSCVLLDLEDNQVGVEGMNSLGEMLKVNCFIQEFNISANYLGDSGCRNVCFMLQQNLGIVSLYLSRNQITDDSVINLSAALMENDRLITLDLSRNSLGERSGGPLQKALANNDTMQHLDLSWNHYRGSTAVALIKGISANCHLTKVDLSYNGLSDSGAVALAKCLRVNTVLQYIDITCNRISFKGAAVLAPALKKNSTLVTFRIGRNPLTNEGALHLLDAISSISSNVAELDLTDICVKPNFEKLYQAIQSSSSQRNLNVKHGRIVERVPSA